MRRLTAVAIVVLIAGVAGCGGGGHAGGASGQPPAGVATVTPVTPVAPVTPEASARAYSACQVQAAAWRHSGGQAKFTAVQRDLFGEQNALQALTAAIGGGAALSGPVAALKFAAASMRSATRAVQANLPPACIPHMRRDARAVMTDYAKAARYCQDAIREVSGQSYTVAVTDIRAAKKAQGAGSAKMNTALADLKAFVMAIG